MIMMNPRSLIVSTRDFFIFVKSIYCWDTVINVIQNQKMLELGNINLGVSVTLIFCNFSASKRFFCCEAICPSFYVSLPCYVMLHCWNINCGHSRIGEEFKNYKTTFTVVFVIFHGKYMECFSSLFWAAEITSKNIDFKPPEPL